MHASDPLDVDVDVLRAPGSVAHLDEPVRCACAHREAAGDTRDEFSISAPVARRWWQLRGRQEDAWLCGRPATLLAFWTCPCGAHQHTLVLCDECAHRWANFPEVDATGIRFVPLGGPMG